MSHLSVTDFAAFETLAAEKARIVAVLAPRAPSLTSQLQERQPLRPSAMRMVSMSMVGFATSAFVGFALPGAIVHFVSSFI